MNRKATALPPRLFTTHGTVIYVDPTSGELRHGPLDGSPANARLVATGAQGQIMYEEAGSYRPIICVADRSQTIDSTGNPAEPYKPTTFQLISLYQRWIGLRAGGLFLSAEPGGRVALSRLACRAWESFMVSEPLPFCQQHACGEPAKRPSLGIS